MKNALIVYASKTGTTQDAANSMAAALSPFCDTYNCCSREKTTGNSEKSVSAQALQWSDYDAVALGTAMYMGKPLREQKKFCESYETEILKKNIFLFTCGVGTFEEDRTYLWHHLPEAITRQALLYSHLGGEIRKGRMSLPARIAMNGYVKEHGAPPGINKELIEEMINKIKSYL